VRLKGGDPLLFGRGAEEASALAEAGVPFEIVPGITAASGAAAYAGLALTHRSRVGAVAFVAGHDNPSKPETATDWAALARFPGTLVVYMGMSRLDRIVERLLEAGMDAGTPSAVVQDATLGRQRTTVAPLHALAEAARREGIAPPAVVVIGSAVASRPELAWFERLPLFGRRVLIARPRRLADSLASRLMDLGAIPHICPTIEIAPPADWAPVDRAIHALREVRWIVFTSVNGVEAFLGRILALGLDLRALGNARLAAIGPATARALESFHLRADLVPAAYQSEHLAEALLAAVQPTDRVLLARADRGREVLQERLAERCTVEQVAVYSQADVVDLDAASLAALRRGEIEFMLMTSANVARSLLARLDATSQTRIRQRETLLVSISPVTSAEIRRLGFEVAAEAEQATMEGVLAALVRLAGNETASSA
jgi:uroporphyrinogen III methyltransferase/synthase